MCYYFICIELPENHKEIFCISKYKKKLNQWIADIDDGTTYCIEKRNINFKIDGLERIWTVAQDINRLDIFIDAGLYFKTYEEALTYIKKNPGNGYLIEPIAVL